MSSKRNKERSSRTCSCVNRSRATTQHQVKQLKNHRKRMQRRGEGRRNRQTAHGYCHCRHGISKDSRRCCPSGGNSKRDQKFVPFTQEHSIITDSRLIGHHGLFNHEIKSFNIERLLSERVKLEKSVKKGQEMSHALLNRSSALRISSPFGSDDLFVHNAVLSPERKAASSLYCIADGQDKKSEASHKSDLMTSPQPYPSTESFKSCFSSKRSFNNEAVTTDKGNSVTHKKEKWPLPCGVNHSSPKSRERPARQTRSSGLSLHRPSLDPGLRGECLASVSTMAAQLCDSVHFANLNRIDLLEESRSALRRVLKAKHGNQLHENLLRNQQCSSFGADGTEMEQDDSLKSASKDDNVLSAEASTCLFDEVVAYVGQENEEMTNKNFGPWTFQALPQEMAPEWPTNPVDTSPILLHDILRPTCYTPLFAFPGPGGKSPRDHLFAPLPASSWPEKASQSQRSERSFNRPETKVSSLCASFEKRSMNPSTEAGHGRRLLKDTSSQQFFLSSSPPPPPPTERQFTKEPFKSDKYAFASPFCNQVHSPYTSSHFHTGPLLSSFPSDTVHYPSSYMLQSKSPPLSPLHGSDHWSFPPMRLY